MKEIKLPRYGKRGHYARFLPENIERLCNYRGRGYRPARHIMTRPPLMSRTTPLM